MLTFLVENWYYVLGGLLVAVLLVWTLQERQEDRTASETGRAVGDKARRYSGGAVGFLSAITIGILGGMYEASMNFGDFLAFAGDVFMHNPDLAGGIVSTLLAYLGLNGTIQLTPLTYLGIAFIILGVSAAAAIRSRGQGA